MGSSQSEGISDEKIAPRLPEQQDAHHTITFPHHHDLTSTENTRLIETFQSLASSSSPPHCGISPEALKDKLTCEVFPTMAKSLYASICHEPTMNWIIFRDFFVDMCRSHSSTPIQIIYRLITSNPDIDPSKHSFVFFLILMECADCLDASSTTVATQLAEYYTTSNENNLDLVHFMASRLPCSAHVITTFFYSRLCPGLKNPKPYDLPALNAPTSIAPHPSQLFPLTLFTPALQGTWIQLFSSDVNGFSFNRIAHHILGYQGPTLLLIKCAGQATGAVIGAYADARWHDSNRFYGTSDTFLFSSTPNFRVYRSREGSNQAYQWLNMKTYGHPHGLGFGGSKEKFRLFIPEAMEACQAAAACLTFEPGPLIPCEAKGVFDIMTLEVWGCGGQEVIGAGLSAQKKDREVRDENIRKAKKVDKAAFFNNDFDREMFLGKTFAHNGQKGDDR